LGIRERRQRQRRELRGSILAAAREIASTEGWRAVTIRKIAALIEYSPPVVYEYFDSKDDLLLELVRMGYAEQLEAVEAARRSPGSAEQVLLRMGSAWWGFAMESPDLYQAMYGLGGVSFPVTELRTEGEKIGAVMAEAVEKFLVENGKEATDVWDKVTILWSSAHGLVALAMAGRIPDSEATKLLDQAVREHLVAWTEA
jgi:AcrR family transcriptional regulator